MNNKVLDLYMRTKVVLKDISFNPNYIYQYDTNNNWIVLHKHKSVVYGYDTQKDLICAIF